MNQTRYEPTLLEAAAAVGCRSVRQWNILRDVELTGRVDVGRLRAALAAAAQLHPLSRARRVVNCSNGWTWQIERDTAGVAVQTADTAAGDLSPLLRELRAERLSPAEPLAFKCIAVRGPSSDHLLFNFCHERTDGIGAMAFLSSLRAAYAGEVDRAGNTHWIEQRRSLLTTPLRGFEVPGLLESEPIEHLVGDSGDSFDDTTHVVNIALSAADSRALTRAGGNGVTVTHQVVAALAIACGRWNSARGFGTGRMCIGVPVNARLTEFARQGFFNAYGTMCINTRPSERLTLEQASRSVATQAHHLKPIAMETGARWAFSTAPAMVPTGPAPTISAGVIPTAVVSNLGVWNLGQFGNAGHVLNVWAPPLPMEPMAVALGMLGVRGGVCLSFRFAASMIGREGGYYFAQTVRELLQRCPSVQSNDLAGIHQA